MKRCLFHRILTLTLALLMVCSQFCVSNVFAQGIDEESYRANVGGTAKLNDTTIYISDNPVSSTNFFEHTLKPDTIAANADTVFAIVDCYVGNGGYWYKLAATDGGTLPDELAARPWVYQNDIPSGGYADALIVTPPQLPSQEYVDPVTGVKVSGSLPAGANVSVTLPISGDGTQPDVFDIKIYDGNGNEWQPIDERKTVTISLPVPYEKAGLTHVIDYADAIEGRSDLTFLPVADITEASLLSLLEPALDAYEAVYGNRDYVAVEEMAAVPAVDGMASFEVNSFSIYIYFDGGNRNAADDWESYFGYADIEAARNAIREQNAVIYKIKVGEKEKLKILFKKGYGQSVNRWYTVKMEQYQNDLFSSMAASTYLKGPTGEDGKSILGIYNYENVSFQGLAATPENSYIYITYKNADGKEEPANKTIIVQVVPENTPVEPEPDDVLPLYIGIDSATNNDVFPFEPTATMSGFKWYRNGGVVESQAPYTKTATNAFFAINAFNKSSLKQSGDGVSAIIDHSGVLTMNFVNLSSSFKDEIIDTMGGGLSMSTHTVLVYAVKLVSSGTYPGYYIMCKVVPKGAMTVSYDTNLPAGVTQTFDDWPAVDIVEATGSHTILYTPSSFETENGNQKDTYTFVGWSTNQDAHPDDSPGENSDTDTDEWYYEEDTITNDGALQGKAVTLYAIWKTDKVYKDATIEFHYTKYDENGTPVAGSAIPATFTVDEKFDGRAYVIYDDTGVLVEEGTFTSNDRVFELQHDYYIIIEKVENNTEPYTITSEPIEGYAADTGPVTEIWLTDAENKQGYEKRYYDVYKQQYTLVWDIDGQKTEVPYYYGASIQSISSPTKNGYNFAGWSPAVPQAMPADDLTLSATWTPINYTIKFNLNGGNGSAPNIPYTIEDSVTLPTTGFQRTGYAFNGWKPSKTVGNWNSGTTYYGTLSDMYGNVTLTAQWVKKSYTITYDYDQGALPSGTTNIGGYETGDVLTLRDPVRAGYEFKGWKITSGGSDWPKKEYDPGEQITTSTGNVTITAQWELKTYEIRYDMAGGTASGSYPTEYNVESSNIQIPDPTREGYVFLGWEGTGLSSATKNLIIPKGSTGIREYTAKWTEQEYTITIDLASGREPQTSKALYNSSVSMPDAPTRNGYIFDCWVISPNVTVTDGKFVMPANDVTIMAKWTINKYTITFDTAGGSEIAPITLQPGETVPAPENPTKEGYIFAGWDKEIPTTMPAENITITAQWKTWMKISVEGAKGSTFVFRITGNGLNMLVVVEGGSPVIISELRVDTQYTVTELSGWSWKYNMTGETSVTTRPQAGKDNEIKFVAQRNDKHWLGGEGEAVSK